MTHRFLLLSLKLIIQCAEYEGEIFISGGYSWTQDRLGRVDVFSPQTATWRQLADLNMARNNHRMVLLNNILTVVGGYGAPASEYCGHTGAVISQLSSLSLLTSLSSLHSNVFSQQSKLHLDSLSFNVILTIVHNPQASKKTSLNLDMERMKINDRRKPLSMSGLSRQARGSSTGSSLSSLSPDEERPKSISSRYSQPSLQQNQRLNKDNLAKLKNRPTKVIESSSQFPRQIFVSKKQF